MAKSLEYTQIKELKEVNPNEMCYVITDMHPEVVSKVDISRVPKDDKIRGLIDRKFKEWVKKGYLYQRQESKR